MKIADFATPATADEARRLLKELGPRGLPVAGATSLLFLRGDQPVTAVDLSRCGLSGIAAIPGGFAIGATTPIADLQDYRAPGWVLHQVADAFVTQQIRHQSTLGGNVARVFPWSDFAVALAALDATFVIEGEAVRRIGAEEYFKGQPARLFQPGDLLTSIEVPAAMPGVGFGYHKQKRTTADYSQATAAAWLELAGGTVRAARVALGASVPMPGRLREMEAAVVGSPASGGALREKVAGALAGLRTATVAGMSREYTAHLSGVVVGDVLEQAVRAAGGEA